MRRRRWRRHIAVAILCRSLALGWFWAGSAPAQGDPTKPETCRELWEKVGLPEYARSRPPEATTTLCHTKYVLSHNNETKTPDWVLERITKEQVIKRFSRPSQKFTADKFLQGPRAEDGDYAKSKFDRGHQAASDDFSANEDWMIESFILSNAVPQVGIGFNQGIWKKLEELVRDVVRNRGELYVITGPIYRPDNGGKITITASSNRCGGKQIDFDPPKRTSICGAKTDCDAGVAVPAGLFKILYDPRMKRANAFMMPNIDHRDVANFSTSAKYIHQYQTTVDMVERHTGLEFLRALSARERRPQLEACGTMMLH